jgi:hypothetical protein
MTVPGWAWGRRRHADLSMLCGADRGLGWRGPETTAPDEDRGPAGNCGKGTWPTSANDGLPDGVVHLEPGHQPGDGQDPAHSALRPCKGKAATPCLDLLGIPGQDAEAGAVDEHQAREVNNAPRAPAPPDVTETRLQIRHLQKIQFTPQGHHGHAAATTGEQLRVRDPLADRCGHSVLPGSLRCSQSPPGSRAAETAISRTEIAARTLVLPVTLRPAHPDDKRHAVPEPAERSACERMLTAGCCGARPHAPSLSHSRCSRPGSAPY